MCTENTAVFRQGRGVESDRLFNVPMGSVFFCGGDVCGCVSVCKEREAHETSLACDF